MKFTSLSMTSLGLYLGTCLFSSAQASVAPMLDTLWAQDGYYKQATPKKGTATTYPGCTTIAVAQVLYYYQYQNHGNQPVSYVLEHGPLQGKDIQDGYSLSLDLSQYQANWDNMAGDLTRATSAQRKETADFIYHVGVSLNAQFGGGEGSSATGRQIENAIRYQWGYNNIRRREMTIISKRAFGYSDNEWADLIRSELDEGRPVLYMAQQANANAGHAFVIDGYNEQGLVHVNFGWGGHGNGYLNPNTLTDPSGRSWNRDAMIYLGLEPEKGYAAELRAPTEPTSYLWQGTGSLLGLSSGDKTDYGFTRDDVSMPASSQPVAAVYQWEIDNSDGTRLEISSAQATQATIQYGPWNDRSQDRHYLKVDLPFVLDPAKDGFSTADGTFYTLAVMLDGQTESGLLSASVTQKDASPVNSQAARPLVLDGALWQGNGTLLSYSLAQQQGYGITQDEVLFNPEQEKSVGYFQWEISEARSLKLVLDGLDVPVNISYGKWDDRSSDIHFKQMSLPFELDIKRDFPHYEEGDYMVIKVEAQQALSQAQTLSASLSLTE